MIIVLRMGTEDMDYHQIAEQSDLYTGGSMSIGTHVIPHHTTTNQFEQVGIETFNIIYDLCISSLILIL